jgi:serine/threonine protein kinase
MSNSELAISVCINPDCTKRNVPINSSDRYCQSCGNDLLLQGRYRVTSLIHGYRDPGYSLIYLIDDKGTPKILKVLQRRHSNRPRVVQLFRQEVDVLRHLDHPGIPKVDGYFQQQLSNGQRLHCIIMEKVDGCDLKEWLKQNQPITQKQALEWLEQLAVILNVIHQQNYLHRDIRSNNIMLKNNGQLVLIDFAGATKRNYIYKAYTYIRKIINVFRVKRIVTDGYTPPEQNKNYCLPQSDFFALGRTFVYLLTGKEPKDKAIYDADNDEVHWREYSCGISPQLADFVDKLMAYNPNHRYKNAQEMLNKIASISQELYPNQIN